MRELENFKNFVLKIIADTKGERRAKVLKDIVKMCTDKILYEHTIRLIQNLGTSPNLDVLCVRTLLGEPSITNPIIEENCTQISTIDKLIRVDLASTPVLASPWNVGRLHNQLARQEAWKMQYDHEVVMYLPLGIMDVYAGNHSIFSGKLQNEGFIEIDVNVEPHRIIDMTPLLELMYFNGRTYNSMHEDKVLFVANDFDFGCLFEMGRILKIHDISLI